MFRSATWILLTLVAGLSSLVAQGGQSFFRGTAGVGSARRVTQPDVTSGATDATRTRTDQSSCQRLRNGNGPGSAAKGASTPDVDDAWVTASDSYDQREFPRGLAPRSTSIERVAVSRPWRPKPPARAPPTATA